MAFRFAGAAPHTNGEPMTIYRQIFFSGRVQAVGFRYTVKQIASGYEVTGWVRNLPDGRVELRADGESAEVAAFVQAIAGSHLAGHIKETTQTDLPAPPDHHTIFEIRH